MSHTSATAATRLGARTARRGAATGSARRGGVFTVVGQEKKLKLDDAWHWKDEEKEYKHIMTILYKQGGFGQNIPIPRSTSASPRLKRDAQHATSSLENTLTAVKMPISLETVQNPSWMYQLRLTLMLDLATQQKQKKMAKRAGKVEEILQT